MRMLIGLCGRIREVGGGGAGTEEGQWGRHYVREELAGGGKGCLGGLWLR